MADNLEFLSVLDGIIKGVNSGLDKRAERNLEERKINAQEEQNLLYKTKTALDQEKMDQFERKMSDQEKQTAGKLDVEKQTVIDKARDNKRQLIVDRTKNSEMLADALSRLDESDPDSVKRYGPHIDSLKLAISQQNDEINAVDQSLHTYTKGAEGKQKIKPPPTSTQAKTTGGKSLGTLNIGLSQFIDQAREYASDPNIGETEVVNYFGRVNTNNYSPDEQAEFKRAYNTLRARKRDEAVANATIKSTTQSLSKIKPVTGPK